MAVATDDRKTLDLEAIEARTQQLGRRLLGDVQRRRPGPWQRRWWDDRVMNWAMQDERVKTQMFRFVDVLPMLKTSRQINEHVQEYFGDLRTRLPWPGGTVLQFAQPESWTGDLIARFARANAGQQARRFIAGTNAEEVLQLARRLREQRLAFTLDVLGEAVTSEAEAEGYLKAYCDLLTNLAPTVNAWPEVPQIDRGPEGSLPRVNISIKLTALDSQFDSIDPDGTYARVAPRLRKLLRLARQQGAFINVDMENYDKKSLTLEVFKRILLEDEFRDLADVGIVIQCYLRDSYSDLVKLHEWAQTRGTSVWVRLVKGAYWDYETVIAKERGWPIPVYQRKWESDLNFERCTRYLLTAYPHLHAALGSHNVRSVAHGLATAEHLGLPPRSYEVQMLYGMADIEKRSLVELGHRVRVYMPYGELIPGMAYLVRRLLENTSNDSFLKASYAETLPPEQLLMNPETHEQAGPAAAPQGGGQTLAGSLAEAATNFKNEPLLDFGLEENRRQFQAGLDRVHGQLGGHYPLVIAGEEIETDEKITSVNPSHKSQVVGTTASATAAEAERAVAAAKAAFPAWAARPGTERAEYLRRVAQLMRDRRFDLAAWMVYESGKSWKEADGDLGEAIDFCEYYALGAEQMEAPRGKAIPGEVNRFRYRPRGVAAVISPWNFPLAILTGMTTAALVTGNTVVMKPAEQSPVIAYKLMELFREAGIPAGVVNYLPGPGETAGQALVEHPDVALIAFTGSQKVGLMINAKAAEVSARGERPVVKKVIAEMGGKNAIIVDEDADLDEAVAGVVQSAFGYSGQKCSACSRAIVLEPVYDQFLQRLTDAVHSLKVGPAEEPGTKVGPLIEQDAVDRVKRAVQQARNEEFRELASVNVMDLAGEGFYLGPHVFADVPPESDLAQIEWFGPVLAVIKAANLDEAIAIANGVPYALTGGIFSRSPANLKRVAEEMEVGNLYLNRGITGAFVGRQPFGGFKHSGIGSQAGGPDYLLQFVVPRTVTENTLRRGFAPVEELHQ